MRTLVPRVALLALLASSGAPAAEPTPTAPTALTWEHEPPPFRRRRRVGVKDLRGRGQGLRDLSRWPAEPSSPEAIDPDRFGAALLEACGWVHPRQLRRMVKSILEHSGTFDVDPFLVAAVIYRQSRCRANFADNYGTGLAAINERMHRGFLQKRQYRYQVFREGAWRVETLPLPKYPFYPGVLKKQDANIYFAAALLAVAKAQCPHNDGAFGSVPHRHFVSHYAWGDRVEGAGAEDRALEARRRLLTTYSGDRGPPLGKFGELALHCPLDGWPRKITSGMGADRDKGARRHMGIDFGSSTGEPVRAVAAGTVVLAGVQFKQRTISMEPEDALKVPNRKMAPGGRLVMIRHPGDLKSGYMHLDRYVVRTGDKVEQGQLIGYVGRSGMRRSAAHLHFELRHAGHHEDPYPHLAPYLVEPTATWVGVRVAKEEKKQRRKRRRARWRRQREQGQQAVPAH